MYFKGTIIITDPCYVIKSRDWESSNYGRNLRGFQGYITEYTLYGASSKIKSWYKKPWNTVFQYSTNPDHGQEQWENFTGFSQKQKPVKS